MQVTIGRGSNRRQTTVATGFLFRSKPAEERRDTVAMLCQLAGIKAS